MAACIRMHDSVATEGLSTVGPTPLQRWIASERRTYLQRSPASAAEFDRALRVLPGGDTRYSLAMDPYPTYVREAEGTRLVDLDGHRYLDLIYNATTLIHGHCHPAVAAAVREQVGRGTAWLAPNTNQVRLAEMLCQRVPSFERVRFTNSGTEATMMMIKTARAFTGRDVILKMDGAYHGSYDGMEFNARSDGIQDPVPYTEGVPATLGANVAIGRFNDPEGVGALIDRYHEVLAGVMLTPVSSTGSWREPSHEFLATIRSKTVEHGILLLFDEVISFRIAAGGAQQHYDVSPDLTALGKVVGGGMPGGAFGGRADVMAVTDPQTGPRLAHAGTFNGNPATTAAGLATLELLDSQAFARLEALGQRFAAGLRDVCTDLSLPFEVVQVGSLVSMVPREAAPAPWREAHEAMRIGLLNRGILGWSVFALPTVMEEAEIDTAVGVFREAFAAPAEILAVEVGAGPR